MYVNYTVNNEMKKEIKLECGKSITHFCCQI